MFLGGTPKHYWLEFRLKDSGLYKNAEQWLLEVFGVSFGNGMSHSSNDDLYSCGLIGSFRKFPPQSEQIWPHIC